MRREWSTVLFGYYVPGVPSAPDTPRPKGSGDVEWNRQSSHCHLTGTETAQPACKAPRAQMAEATLTPRPACRRGHVGFGESHAHFVFYLSAVASYRYARSEVMRDPCGSTGMPHLPLVTCGWALGLEPHLAVPLNHVSPDQLQRPLFSGRVTRTKAVGRGGGAPSSRRL